VILLPKQRNLVLFCGVAERIVQRREGQRTTARELKVRRVVN
jgi:hypothetical protein